MKVVIAPDSFKESLSAPRVCEAVARGIRRAAPDSVIESIPMADGGEGTVDAMVAATSGGYRETVVSGPLGDPVTARWGLLGGDGGAVIELAAASGLALVEREQRDPTKTTTFGTGELIRAAVDAGVSRILVGIGGSATNDGGTGAAQAVGVRFLDEHLQPIEEKICGGAISRVARIDATARDPRLTRVAVRVACDVDNPLCGPRGAAATYGPQKGASPGQVQLLDRNLAHLADLIKRDLGKDVREFPGAGAAGGMGAGLVAFFDARIERGVRLVMDAVRFERRIAGADLILTGEGRIDRQSMMGKVIEGVGRAGRAVGIPVVALVGSIGEGAEEALAVLHSFHCIHPPETPRETAFARTPEALEAAAERVLREFST